ncbi:MAG: hypothetical protein ACYCRH_06415 [Acidiferrobacteraceae bacterium]
MKGIAFKQTLLALVLAGCTASAYAMTVSHMTSDTHPSTGQAITGSGSFSSAASDTDDLDPDDSSLPVSNVLPPSDPPSTVGTGSSGISPVPEASDSAMMLAGLMLLGGVLRKRGKRL